MSTSTDLTQEARRDLAAVGFGPDFLVIEGPQELDGGRGAAATARAAAAKKAENGAVLFCTYTTLAMPARGRKPSRLEQVIAWATGGNGGGGNGNRSAAAREAAAAAWDGVIVFDECHKSKGLTPGDSYATGASGVADLADAGGGGGGGWRRGGRGGGGTSSKVSLAVVELQARLPSARVLYTSATGVSSLADCGYLVSCNDEREGERREGERERTGNSGQTLSFSLRALQISFFSLRSTQLSLFVSLSLSITFSLSDPHGNPRAGDLLPDLFRVRHGPPGPRPVVPRSARARAQGLGAVCRAHAR